MGDNSKLFMAPFTTWNNLHQCLAECQMCYVKPYSQRWRFEDAVKLQLISSLLSCQQTAVTGVEWQVKKDPSWFLNWTSNYLGTVQYPPESIKRDEMSTLSSSPETMPFHTEACSPTEWTRYYQTSPLLRLNEDTTMHTFMIQHGFYKMDPCSYNANTRLTLSKRNSGLSK
jgi:hypothetical protein